MKIERKVIWTHSTISEKITYSQSQRRTEKYINELTLKKAITQAEYYSTNLMTQLDHCLPEYLKDLLDREFLIMENL